LGGGQGLGACEHRSFHACFTRIDMTLNKHDFDSHRRAKRMRALKIDFLIIVIALLIGIWMTIDHPPPASNTPAFHKAHAERHLSQERPIDTMMA
jgi:hypothetical protein